MTIVRPPRSRMRVTSPIRSGYDSSEPFDACGLAPMITSRSVLATSGTGMLHALPYSWAHTRFFGHWSTVPADHVTGMPARPGMAPEYRLNE